MSHPRAVPQQALYPIIGPIFRRWPEATGTLRASAPLWPCQPELPAMWSPLRPSQDITWTNPASSTILFTWVHRKPNPFLTFLPFPSSLFTLSNSKSMPSKFNYLVFSQCSFWQDEKGKKEPEFWKLSPYNTACPPSLQGNSIFILTFKSKVNVNKDVVPATKLSNYLSQFITSLFVIPSYDQMIKELMPSFAKGSKGSAPVSSPLVWVVKYF